MCEWVLSFIIIHVLIHTFESHLLPTVQGGLCYDKRCLGSPTWHFHPWFPFITEINFHLFVVEQKWETSIDKKSRDIYHQLSPTTLTDRDTCSYTSTNTHSNSTVWFHPPIFTHTFSLTIFTYLLLPTFCRPPFLTLSFFTLTDSFHPLCHRNRFSLMMLCALV